MNGWLYLIKNGDLYKIGITRNLDNRMRQLKPDNIVAKLYSCQFKQLEKEFHKRYKNVRIPQTEYFRLDLRQIREIKRRLSKFSYPERITIDIFKNTISILLVLFIIVLLITFLTINDINEVISISLKWMESISFVLSFVSLLFKSNKYFNILNEIKFRSSRFFILVIFSLCFRYVPRFLFNV